MTILDLVAKRRPDISPLRVERAMKEARRVKRRAVKRARKANRG